MQTEASQPAPPSLTVQSRGGLAWFRSHAGALIDAKQFHFCRCGFHDIVPRIWVDRINAVIPDLGFHVHWHGLWMEAAEGISFESLLHKGEPTKIPRPVMMAERTPAGCPMHPAIYPLTPSGIRVYYRIQVFFSRPTLPS